MARAGGGTKVEMQASVVAAHVYVELVLTKVAFPVIHSLYTRVVNWCLPGIALGTVTTGGQHIIPGSTTGGSAVTDNCAVSFNFCSKILVLAS